MHPTISQPPAPTYSIPTRLREIREIGHNVISCHDGRILLQDPCHKTEIDVTAKFKNPEIEDLQDLLWILDLA